MIKVVDLNGSQMINPVISDTYYSEKYLECMLDRAWRKGFFEAITKNIQIHFAISILDENYNIDQVKISKEIIQLVEEHFQKVICK